MNTFIKAAECWIPSPGQPLLEFGGGIFGLHRNFESISQGLCFGMGEGLPGQAWEERRPILLKDFDSQHFRRGAAAKAAGFQCAVALPCYQGDQLKSVLVLYCGDTSGLPSGLELWGNDPRITSDLTLHDACYGRDAQTLEPEAKDTYLPRGTGLPGMAWQRDAVVYMADLATSPRFLRGESAVQAGLQTGLAIPLATAGAQAFVLTVLSAKQTPIARRIEGWIVKDGKLQCELAQGEPLFQASTATLIQQAWDDGLPHFAQCEEGVSASLVAIPLLDDGCVSEVLVLYC